MRYVLGIAWREYRIRLKNPILPMWDILVPVIYLLVFGASLDSWLGAGAGSDAFGPGGYPTFFLGGVLAMVSFSIGLNSAYAFFEDLQSGIFHELLTYPFARRDLILGKTLFNAGFSAAGAVVCLAAAGTVLGVRISPGGAAGLVAWTAAGTAGWLFLCSWIALLARGFNAYHTTSSALYLLLMFVSNLFYPTDRLPGWARGAAAVNPVTWQVDLLRASTYGGLDMERGAIEAALFLAFIAATYLLVNRSLNANVE